MNTRVTLVLAVAVAMAMALLVWDTRSTREVERAPADRIKRLLRFDVEAVDSLRIWRRGTALDFQKTAAGWTGTSNPQTIRDFLADLLALAEIAFISSSLEDLEPYGLTRPATIVEWTTARKRHVVKFGKRNPAGTAIYAQVGDDGPVVLTGAAIDFALERIFQQAPRPTLTATPDSQGHP